MNTQNTTTTSRRGRDYWQNHVNEWNTGGGTQSNYCRQHNLSERLFSMWKNKFIKEQAQSQDKDLKVNFIPVVAKENSTKQVTESSNVVITLPNGIRLDVTTISSGANIAELAKHLVVLSC